MVLREALIVRAKAANVPLVGAGDAARIHWGTRPQGSALPALVLAMVSSNPDQLLSGEGDFWVSRVQVEGWARSIDDADVIAKAASAALLDEAIVGDAPNPIEFEPAERSGPRDTVESDEKGPVHRVLMDVILRHSADT